MASLALDRGTLVHVITGLSNGGAERMLAQIAEYNFDGRAPRQVVVSLTSDGVYGERLRRAGIEVHSMGGQRGRPSVLLLLKLIALLRRERPYLVMTWLYHADLIGTIAAALSGSPPVIWNIRCSDIDMACYSRASRMVLRSLVRLSRRPWAIATNSISGRNAHERLGYNPRRWFYLPNGVDVQSYRPNETDRADVRRELNVDEHAVLVILPARVDPMKDHQNFLEAAESVSKTHPEAIFVLAGAGTERLTFPAALNGRLRLLGERMDIARLLRGMDLMVLSSRSEGFPNVIAEAMASGLTCVVTDVGDAREILGDTGVVLAPRNPGALAAAIGSALTLSPERRWELGARARKRVAYEWSISRAAERYLEVWEAAFAATLSKSPEHVR